MAGADEAGRGCLAGPVVAASAGLRWHGQQSELNLSCLKDLQIRDSKKLSRQQRGEITANFLSLAGGTWSEFCTGGMAVLQGPKWQLGISVSSVDHKTIDKINILQASMLAMSESFKRQYQSDDRGIVLIDGSKATERMPGEIKEIPVVKGDTKSWLIGIASIFAKEYRDHTMAEYGRQYPDYGFEKHMGYPTTQHTSAIMDMGITPIHRRSFRLKY